MLNKCKWSSTEEPQEVYNHFPPLFHNFLKLFLNLGGSLASDDLYLLDMRNGEEMAQWMIVPVVGSTPGRRYGHTIVFSKPHLLVFGGNTG